MASEESTTRERTTRSGGSAAALAALLALVIVGAIVATLFARSRWWLPPLASVHGREVDRLLFVTFGIISAEVHLVVNRPVEVRLRSKDVLHSFFVPAFRVKQDAVPGITVSFWFIPTATGTYEIACAELCGVGHYAMRGKVVVETQEQFDAWLGGPKS